MRPNEANRAIPLAPKLADLFEIELVDPMSDGAARTFTPVSAVTEGQGAIEEASDPDAVRVFDPQDLIGRTLGGYRLVERIGSGGQAIVYRAVRDTTGEDCAIKVLMRPTPEGISRMRRESRVLAEIHHPNIVSIIGSGETEDGFPYLITELLNGRTLRKLLHSEPLPWDRCAAIAVQIAAALVEAHRSNLVHRDLKPSNIMLIDEAGFERVKILDFGLARISDGMATALTFGLFRGTPLYSAPEQIRDASSAGPAADLYAFGAILYEMVAGRPPFVGTVRDILEAHLTAMPAPPPDANGLGALAMKLLAKDPRERPPSAGAVLDALGPRSELPATKVIRPLRSGSRAAPDAAVSPPLDTVLRPISPVRAVPRWLMGLALIGSLVIVAVALGAAVVVRSADSDVVLASSEPSPDALDAPSARPIMAPDPDPGSDAAARPQAVRGKAVRHLPAFSLRARAADEDGSDQGLARVLASRGLSREDLRMLGGDALENAISEARAASDRSRERSVRTALVDLARSAPIGFEVVMAKLQRIGRHLQDESTPIAEGDRDALEDEYFRLRRSAMVAKGDPRMPASVMLEIAAFERKLNDRRARPKAP